MWEYSCMSFPATQMSCLFLLPFRLLAEKENTFRLSCCFVSLFDKKNWYAIFQIRSLVPDQEGIGHDEKKRWQREIIADLRGMQL